MLQMRILCKFLPQNFDHLENFISPLTYLPLNNNQKCIEIKNKRYKIIQEGKRVWLNYFFNTSEIKIYEYEQQYQCEYIQLETQLLNNPSVNNSTLFNHINEYINCRINRLKKEIYDKMSSFRRILLQNRQRSSSTKTTIGVSPEPYLDLMYNPFLTSQWNHLSLGEIFLLNMF
jgi:hypothetical protein